MEDGDVDSEFGSVISLQSLDDGSHYQEKPKHVKKSKGRDHSPYLSHSNNGGLNHRTGLKRSTGHEAWSSAIRNGFSGLSSENSPANRIVSPQVYRKSKTSLGHSSTNSAGPFSRDEHMLASGKPAYKSQEDYYDEVMELRQVIKALKTDNGVLKTKLQRLTQENVLKDRQIKDFLNPNKQPEEIRRTLTDRNADSSAVVSSLKQKLHLMERNVKDKENELRKLKSDLKSTNIDELRIEMDTYYEETQRLQTVLSSVYSNAPGTRNITESRSNLSRSSSRMNTPRYEEHGRVGEDRLEQILDEKRRLESENQSLKKDLLCAIDGRDGGKSLKKNVDYADMNRLQMLKKIGELEQLLEDAKAKQKKMEPKRSPGKDSETEVRQQREVIENLKQDRTHYREQVEKLRAKLEAAEDEIVELKEKLRRSNEEQKEKLKRGKEENLGPSALPPRPTPRQRNKPGSLKKKISFHGVDKEAGEETFSSRREDGAARVLQRNWRKYRTKNTPYDEDVSSDVVQVQSILRAHASRRQRVQLLSNTDDDVEEDLEWEDAVTRVQSAMRAHHARRKYYSSSEKFSKNHLSSEKSDDSDEKQEKRNMFKQQSFLKKSAAQPSRHDTDPRSANSLFVSKQDESDDSDDDVVVGSRTNLRSEARNFSTPRDQAPVRNQKSYTAAKERRSGDREKAQVNSEDSDDVQISTRFGKSIPSSKKIAASDKDEFSFGNSSKKREVDEQRLRSFFGKDKKDSDDPNDKGEKSSLDNFFTSSRSTQQKRFDSEAGSDPESEANVKKNKESSEEMVEEKPKKALFSWGSSKRNTSKNTPVPAPRRRITSNNKETKSTNVWSSRPSEALDEDDDDDDVVVTPKISRKNPTKTASLLDELF